MDKVSYLITNQSLLSILKTNERIARFEKGLASLSVVTPTYILHLFTSNSYDNFHLFLWVCQVFEDAANSPEW